MMPEPTTIKGCIEKYPAKIEVHNHIEGTIMYIGQSTPADHPKQIDLHWVVERIQENERVELYRGLLMDRKLAVHIFITGTIPSEEEQQKILYGKAHGYNVNIPNPPNRHSASGRVVRLEKKK